MLRPRDRRAGAGVHARTAPRRRGCVVAVPCCTVAPMSNRFVPTARPPWAAAALLLAACGGAASPTWPPGEQVVEARGHYTLGFETNAFVPCGASQGWWVRSLDSVPDVRAYLAARQQADPRAYVTLFVRWRGVLSDTGRYGHLDAFPREFRPRAALEVRDTTAIDCR
jgi:hypothetical protein